MWPSSPLHLGEKTREPSDGFHLDDTIGFSDCVISQNMAHENLAIIKDNIVLFCLAHQSALGEV